MKYAVRMNGRNDKLMVIGHILASQVLRERPSAMDVVTDMAASWICRAEASLDTQVHFSSRAAAGDATPLQIDASPLSSPSAARLPAAIFPLHAEKGSDAADAAMGDQQPTLLTPNSARLLAEKGEAWLRLLETGETVSWKTEITNSEKSALLSDLQGVSMTTSFFLL